MQKTATISKVIAFELGVLIAVLTWIAFAGVPGMKPHVAAPSEDRETPDTSFANVSPNYHPKKVRPAAPVDYPADDPQTPSRAAQYPVATVQTYDPGLVDAAYGNLTSNYDDSAGAGQQSTVEGYVVNDDPADSIGIFPEPVLEDPYGYYSPYGQNYGYAQPTQIVILNNNRSVASRERRARRPRMERVANGPQRTSRPTPRRQANRGGSRPNQVTRGRRSSARPRPPVNGGRTKADPHRGNAVAKKALPAQSSRGRWQP